MRCTKYEHACSGMNACPVGASAPGLERAGGCASHRSRGAKALFCSLFVLLAVRVLFQGPGLHQGLEVKHLADTCVVDALVG